MNYRIRVDDSHFEYLKLQKGGLDAWSDDRAEWHRLYESAVRADYEGLAPHLPEQCWGLLDVGSGLGGIDVLLSRHYEARSHPFLYLMDGVADAPQVTLHRKTFNHADVTKDFLCKNGVRPGRIYCVAPPAVVPHPFDLVLSLGSWCFHYPPAEYLPLLVRCLHRDLVLIVDVRADRPDYERQLLLHFERTAVIEVKSKYVRAVFRPRVFHA